MISVHRTLDSVRWYLREVAGENSYARYLDHELREHPERPALSRRQFERQRQDDRDRLPQQRCC